MSNFQYNIENILSNRLNRMMLVIHNSLNFFHLNNLVARPHLHSPMAKNNFYLGK